MFRIVVKLSIGKQLEYGFIIMDNDIFITFGFQDNVAYVLKTDVNVIKEFIYA